jgi:ABC-type sugar transport system ATPase subunit
MIEIARALLYNPHIIIFDEPTSSLTTREKNRLFEVIRSLKGQGVAIIYISHFMDEIFEICDRAVVLRDGQVAGDGTIAELTHDDIVQMMIGRSDIQMTSAKSTAPIGDSILMIEGLHREGVLQNVNFHLRKGEVVGLWGLMGSGRTELARALVGLDPISSGVMKIKDNGSMRTIHPKEAKDLIGMITEDRREEGLLLPMSVKHNISLANLRALISRIWPLIDTKKETELASKFVDRLQIKISGLSQPVSTLSGGNQQKVVVSRWLQKNPLIYIMDEPTRGLDVGAKAEIREIITELAEAGSAILAIFSDIDEIMSVSHRYLVMHRGQIVSKLPGDASKDELMSAAAGVL